MSKSFTASSEADIINAAIDLDQSNKPNHKAGARALRGIIVPFGQWIEGEANNWRTADDVTTSADALASSVSSMIVSFGMTATRGDVEAGEKFALSLTELVSVAVEKNIAAMKRLATDGKLPAGGFNAKG